MKLIFVKERWDDSLNGDILPENQSSYNVRLRIRNNLANCSSCQKSQRILVLAAQTVYDVFHMTSLIIMCLALSVIGLSLLASVPDLKG